MFRGDKEDIDKIQEANIESSSKHIIPLEKDEYESLIQVLLSCVRVVSHFDLTLSS